MWECQYKREIASELEKSSQYIPPFSCKHKFELLTKEDILNGVRTSNLFGVVECDLGVPEVWPIGCEKQLSPKEYFAEMSPIFCTTDINHDHLSEEMKNYYAKNNLGTYSSRLLVGGMRAQKILIATPLLQWYMSHGIEVTKIYRAVEYIPNACFKEFQQEVSNARRAGDLDPSTSIIADTMKLLGNSGYGSMIMNKENHQSLVYAKGEGCAKTKINQPNFRHLSELGDDLYEIQLSKKCIELNLPTILGYFILQYAKLRMLDFYYNCIDKYIDRSNFEYVEMDTDSAYLATATKTLVDSVKPELRDEFKNRITGFCNDNSFIADSVTWFPRECCDKHIKHDKRTPGLFKLEASGEEIIALSSKTYVLKSGDTFKLSCKGINKKSVTNPLPMFSQALKEKKVVSATNIGFRCYKSTIYSYTQQRAGFGYFYSKRKVLSDGVNTEPLDITLCPWTDHNLFCFNDNHPLGLNYNCSLTKHGRQFHCARQLYEYECALFHKDEALASSIVSSPENYKVITNHKTDWWGNRDKIMKNILALKSEQVPIIQGLLQELRGKNYVYTDNPDKYWSCGLTFKLAPLVNPNCFPGMNLLGNLWNKINDDVE